MTPEKMTRKDFNALPRLSWDATPECRALVILPSRRMHDSGYRMMGFALINEKGEAFAQVGGGSDVIHIDGIGGRGPFENWPPKGVPHRIPPSGWSIDCLPVSGLLRMWPSSMRLRTGASLSSFEIFALPKEDTL